MMGFRLGIRGRGWAAGAMFAAGGPVWAQGVLTVTPGPTIATVAGTPGVVGYAGDGSAALGAALAGPSSVAYDAAGNLYIADALNHVVWEVSTNGTISTIAGNGQQGFAGDGGPATGAMLDTPRAVAVDASGNVYIADTHNNVVREVSGGTISTIAGLVTNGVGVAGFSGDGGSAVGAAFAGPCGLAFDGSGNLYVADSGNHRVREVLGGAVVTVAGNGNENYTGDGSAATGAALDTPEGLAFDGAGNLYLADSHNHAIRVVSGNTIATLAGTGAEGFGGDGGAPAAAVLATPYGVSVDFNRDIYIADTGNDRVRVIQGGVIGTIAGNGIELPGVDGSLATGSGLSEPRAAVLNPNDAVVIADMGNAAVRAVRVPTLNFGSSPVGTGTSSQTVTLGNGGTAGLVVSAITLPAGYGVSGGSCGATPISIAAGGSCTVALEFTPVTTGTDAYIATFGGQGFLSQGVFVTGVGVGDVQTITFPPPPTPVPYIAGEHVTLTATSSAGSGYPVSYAVTGPATLVGSVLTYTGPGMVQITATQAGDDTYAAAAPVVVNVVVQSGAGGRVFVANANGTVSSFFTTGVVQASAVAGGGAGVAVDASGNVWSVDVGGTGLAEFADAGNLFANTSGLSGVSGLTIDSAGRVWVVSSAGTLSAVSTATGASVTAAGTTGGLNMPAGVSVDASGNLWIANGGINTVTEVLGGAAPTVSPLAQGVTAGTPVGKP